MYYKTTRLHEVGDVIPPGNWGRTVLGIGGRHDAFFKEYLLERLRKREFPERPSRLEVAFAFQTFEFAEQWKRSATPEIIYRVSLENAQALQCSLDMSWLDLMIQYRSFDGVEDVARNYWRGDKRQPDAMETLIAGSLIINERMTEFLENGHS